MAKKQWLLTALVATALATAAPAALAKRVRISESEAIEIANSTIGGRVVDVDFEHRKHGRDYYEVEIRKDGHEYIVYVDAQTGRVIDGNGGVEVYPDDGVEVYPDTGESIEINPHNSSHYDPHGYYGY